MEVESTEAIDQQYDWMDRAVSGFCDRLKSSEEVDCECRYGPDRDIVFLPFRGRMGEAVR